jgi:hypothetical protein
MNYALPTAVPGRQFQIKLRRHTGLLFLFQFRTYVVTGTLEQCERAYRQAQTHNLLAGWWSVISVLLLNWIALLSNRSAIARVRRLAGRPQAFGLPPVVQETPQVPAGWYRDPSGAPGQRYWDGTTWTHWTHGVS